MLDWLYRRRRDHKSYFRYGACENHHPQRLDIGGVCSQCGSKIEPAVIHGSRRLAGDFGVLVVDAEFVRWL